MATLICIIYLERSSYDENKQSGQKIKMFQFNVFNDISNEFLHVPLHAMFNV